ncbi:MAG: hypothetical protein RL642_1615 [Bacteroidota bacterium]
MLSDFNTLYQSLNAGQKQAVDAIEGPVMVIAGPGTGKTQILAARILNILQKTDARPEDILCLTYTESGATAMRQRLSKFMGADAYRVNIYTFHGLCNRIIQEFPAKFAQRELRVMDDLEKLELLDTIIRNIPSDAGIKNYQEDPASLRFQLSKVFDLMQEENYTVEIFQEMVSFLSDENQFMETFPEFVYKTTTKWGDAGTIKRAKYDEYIKDWNKLLDAAQLFEVYQSRKKELGIYEFRDMIHWVLDAFKNDFELLQNYQEKFQYLLVDEYQDTSGVQNEIVYQLISFWEDNPNCFVVGDDDQSIYAFQGARVSNMREFMQRYQSNLTTIVLTENYRSTQKILDASSQVIENNQLRLVNQMEGLSKNLISAGAMASSPAQDLRFQNYRNRFHEAVGIVNEIELLHSKGVPYHNIAVIYAKHAIAEETANMLRLQHIPFMLARSVDILAEPMIKQLCNWLQYLALELEVPHKGQHLLFELLHYKLYPISPYEIATISVDINKRKSENLMWRDYMAEYSARPTTSDLFAPEKHEALKTLWNNIELWLKNAASMNVPQLVETVIANGGFLGLALGDSEREWKMEQLHTFLNFATSANQKRPFLTLGDFMEDIEKMRKNKIAIPLEKRIGSKEGITLTTAHSSKGLEYEHVFIIGAEQEAWEKDRSSGLPFKLSKLFQGRSISLKNTVEKEESIEERRRLFYVAMTRAKETLHISWANKKIDAKESDLHPSQFLIEIIGGEEIPESSLEGEQLIDAETKLLQAIQPPSLHIKETHWLKKQLESFKFSPTTLYDILECGLKFYFLRLVKVPGAPSASLGYGLAVHDTLSRLVSYGLDQKKWPDTPTLISWFEFEMFKKRSSFTRLSYETRLQQGRDQLPDYYAARMEEFKTYQAVIMERWLETSIEGIVIGGKSDKLIFNGNHVTIVDYKTGNSKNAEKMFKPPGAKSIESGKLPPKYWFQLGIYHLIVNNQRDKNWKAEMSVIDSLERNDEGIFPVFKQTYSEEDLSLLKHYLLEGNKKLQNLEFLTGCGKPDCEWCKFSKETGQSSVQIPEE